MKNKLSFLFLLAVVLGFSACEEKKWHEDNLKLSPVYEISFTDYTNDPSNGEKNIYYVYSELDYFVKELGGMLYKHSYTDLEYTVEKDSVAILDADSVATSEFEQTKDTRIVEFSRVIDTYEKYDFHFDYDDIAAKGNYKITHIVDKDSTFTIGYTSALKNKFEYVDPNFVEPQVVK